MNGACAPNKSAPLPSAFLQNVYALFLSLGHHESHARRVNQAMHARMALALTVIGDGTA
jgi:GntR family transcriptional regulator / MocR family aminotransferase